MLPLTSALSSSRKEQTMFRTTLAVALTAASLGLATPANAFWDVVMNGASLNGCSEQGTSFNGYEQDAHPITSAAPGATQPLTVEAVIFATGRASSGATAAEQTQEAETTPLVVEAFLSNVPYNGTSLDGISPSIDMDGVKLGTDDLSTMGANALDDEEPNGVPRCGYEQGADPRANAAKTAPLTVEAFLQIPSNGISLNGVTLNGAAQAQGHSVTEPDSASPALTVQAIFVLGPNGGI
jgi:hypothetical protein